MARHIYTQVLADATFSSDLAAHVSTLVTTTRVRFHAAPDALQNDTAPVYTLNQLMHV
jgi:hypothetical protein